MPLFTQSTQILRGTWAASAGQRVFQGSWSATLRSQTPDLAEGTWALFGPSGKIVLEGTWSAQKSPRVWQGTWAARAASGASFSGTWQTQIGAPGGKTLLEMLQQSRKNQINGTWRSGRFQGSWSVRAAP